MLGSRRLVDAIRPGAENGGSEQMAKDAVGQGRDRADGPGSAEADAQEIAHLRAQVAQLTRERDEALEQQTATAEVLRVIASSPTDLSGMLSVIGETAARFCGASDALIH